jgi:hypothetical protein
MKLSHGLTLAGIGIGTFVTLAALQGCSSSSSPASTSSVGGPPAKPSGPATTSTEEHNFALQTLFLGDQDRSGVTSQTAWKSFGYNLDGKVSTASSSDVCTLQAGAPKQTQVDGDNGIDNSFGENILPIIITTAGQDAASKINQSIGNGGFTVMFDVTGLADSQPTLTATGLKGFLNAGSTFDPDGGTKPTFTTADNWPVSPELLNDPTNPKSSKVQFSDAYSVGGTFVSGVDASGHGLAVTLNLSIGGVSIDIAIVNAFITFNHSPGQATNGTIAGVINSQDLVDKLRTVAGRISTSLCGGNAFNSIAQQILQASDIMADGTNGAGQQCNAISIGLGFTAKEIALPTRVAQPAAPKPDPCADAGTD